MPRRPRRGSFLFTLVSLGPLSLAAPATGWCAGFGIDYESATAVGTATAGSAAAEDASTIFYNPAGLGFLPANEIVAGGDLFLLYDRFQNQGSSILGGLSPTPGTNGNEAIPPAFVPWLYANYRMSPEWSAGIGLYSPFGLRTDYGPFWVGRYQNEVTSLTAINVNPTIAYRPTPWLSIGIGADIQYVYVRLTQAIDFGSICAGTLGAVTCGVGFGLLPGMSDGQVDNRGSGFGFGYNLGILLQPIEGTRFGVAFRSGITEHISGGTQSFVVPPSAREFLAAGGMPLAFTGSAIDTSLPLPARLTFGIKQKITPRLNFLADATLTLWDVFRNVSVTAQNEVTGASVVIQENYKNAWRFAAGLEWAVGEHWTLRGGVAYDETPIPKPAVQAALPDADRVYVSAGASVRLSPAWGADLGYSRVIYVNNVGIDRTASGSTLNGVFSSGGNIIAAQLRFNY